MKKKQGIFKNEFDTPLFNEIRQIFIPFLETNLSKEYKAKVTFEKFYRLKTVYFMAFRTSLEAPNDGLIICLDDYLDVELALKESLMPISCRQKPIDKDLLLEHIENLKFNEPKLNTEAWIYMKDIVIPEFENLLSEQLKRKCELFTVINENNVPVLLMMCEEAKILFRYKFA